MDASPVDLSVIVVNYNTSHLLGRMFDTLRASAQGLSMQVVVIDNASRDDSVQVLRERYPDVELIVNTTNVGFGRANNQGVPLLRGQYVLLLNTDAFVAPDTLHESLEAIRRHPRCGALGVRLTNSDGSLQPSCRYFPTPLNLFLGETGLHRYLPGVKLVDDMNWDHATERQCDWVPGCYFLMPRAVVDQVGLFDPRFFLYFEEVDLCRRIKQAGWDVLFLPDTSVIHIGGESAKMDQAISAKGRQIPALQVESQLLYFRKHYGLPGLWSSVVLTYLTAVLQLISGARRGEFGQRMPSIRARLALLNSLLRSTRLGTVPTR